MVSQKGVSEIKQFYWVSSGNVYEQLAHNVPLNLKLPTWLVMTLEVN